MAYKQIKKRTSSIAKIALWGLGIYGLYSVIGIGVVFLFLGIALVIGIFYFLAMCLAAGLDNKFGMADAYLWKKPEQLPAKRETNNKI